jgi:hypothetical protein
MSAWIGSPSYETLGRSEIQELFRFVLNPAAVYYFVRIMTPLDPVSRQLNLVYTLSVYVES